MPLQSWFYVDTQYFLKAIQSHKIIFFHGLICLNTNLVYPIPLFIFLQLFYSQDLTPQVTFRLFCIRALAPSPPLCMFKKTKRIKKEMLLRRSYNNLTLELLEHNINLWFWFTGQRITRALRERVFGSVMKQEVAFFDQNRTGELINRLSTDTSLVSQCVTMNISDGLRSTIMVCAGVSMMVSLFIFSKITLPVISRGKK